MVLPEAEDLWVSSPSSFPSSSALQRLVLTTAQQVCPASAGAPGTIWPSLPGYSSSLPTLWSPVRGKSLAALRAEPASNAVTLLRPQCWGASSPTISAVKGARPTRPHPHTCKLRHSGVLKAGDPSSCVLKFERL